jgi:hypothetical protein
VNKVTPARLLVLRGSEADCLSVVRFAKGLQAAAAPANREPFDFFTRSEKLKVSLPQALLPRPLCPVWVYSSSTGGLVPTKCAVAAVAGLLEEGRASAAQEGTRLLKYQGPAAAPTPVSAGAGAGAGDGDAMQDDDEGGEAAVFAAEAEGGAGPGGAEAEAGEEEHAPGTTEPAVRDQRVEIEDSGVGVVSMGEVTLSSLRQLIEASGVSVEFRVDSEGAVLICGGQVMIRKSNASSDFTLEGPPVPAFYEARKALYQQFAFV